MIELPPSGFYPPEINPFKAEYQQEKQQILQKHFSQQTQDIPIAYPPRTPQDFPKPPPGYPIITPQNHSQIPAQPFSQHLSQTYPQFPPPSFLPQVQQPHSKLKRKYIDYK